MLNNPWFQSRNCVKRSAHRARHCWAVRPRTYVQMRDHWLPYWPKSNVSFVSSTDFQESRLIDGSRWRRQRPMHCWSVRPCTVAVPDGSRV